LAVQGQGPWPEQGPERERAVARWRASREQACRDCSVNSGLVLRRQNRKFSRVELNPNAGLCRFPEIEKPPHHVIVLNANAGRQQASVEGNDERADDLNTASAEFGEQVLARLGPGSVTELAPRLCHCGSDGWVISCQPVGSGKGACSDLQVGRLERGFEAAKDNPGFSGKTIADCLQHTGTAKRRLREPDRNPTLIMLIRRNVGEDGVRRHLAWRGGFGGGEKRFRQGPFDRGRFIVAPFSACVVQTTQQVAVKPVADL
jgi:hypothetical protein